MKNRGRAGLVLVLMAVVGVRGTAAEVYVAPDGSDNNPGTLEKPFATVQRAQTAVGSGDTVFVRGGTYKLTDADIARKQRIWAYVTHLDKSGERGKPIRYFAYKDERVAKLHALGDEAAAHFRSVLPDALARFRHVVVATHVPPFRESCWHEGKVSDDNWLPFFSCKAVGDVLARASAY